MADLIIDVDERLLFCGGCQTSLCLGPLVQSTDSGVCGAGAAGSGWRPWVTLGTPPPRGQGGVWNMAVLRPHPFLLKREQQATGNERKVLNLLTLLESETYLPTSGPDHWVGAGTLQSSQ